MCDGNNLGIPQLLLGRRNFMIALVRKASSDKPGLQSVHLSECCRKKGEASVSGTADACLATSAVSVSDASSHELPTAPFWT